jgi:hypothetical protein
MYPEVVRPLHRHLFKQALMIAIACGYPVTKHIPCQSRPLGAIEPRKISLAWVE